MVVIDLAEKHFPRGMLLEGCQAAQGGANTFAIMKPL